MPRVDDLLDALQGSCLFSTLDLRSGYWQVSVAPNDRKKTAFVTPDGLWEFCSLPFGITGGCATFQKAIEIVLSGLSYDTCLCYFDDVIVPSTNLQQHCVHKLRVKATKCHFGAKRVRFLGHVVSSKGVHTDPQKIDVVSSLSTPRTLEHVRSVLGLAGYYRRFIPNFATIAAPLVGLTKKGKQFCWGDKQQEAFTHLKQLLCTAPVLAYLRLDEPFVLQTDASDLGLGAVLTQSDNSGLDRVVSYASRALTNREKGFSTTEKEALAIVFATDQFRPYLLGRKFEVVTDHSALRWLHPVEPKGRLARWVMHLQEYDFTVVHRSGSENGNADGLSRLIPLQRCTPTEPDTTPSSTTFATTIQPSCNLQTAQREDARLKTVIDLKSSRMPKPPLFVWRHDSILKALWHCWDSLHIVDGMLVKSDNPEKLLPEYSFVIPSQLVLSVLQGIHSSPFAGHLGLKKTLLRTKNRFFWPMMKKDIFHFVRSCPDCAQSKLDSSRNTAPLQPIQVSEPFVFWAMDYMGPLPETPRGNKHLLVVMDHFTKWCEIFPTPDQKARTVAQTLVSSLFGRFGPPHIIHSDQGRNFESHLMHEVCQIMGTHKSRTTAYHPQCDGLVERQNRTIQEMLSAFVSQHQDD